MAIGSIKLSMLQGFDFFFAFFLFFSLKFTCPHNEINDSVVGPSPWIMDLLRAKFLSGSYVICLVLKIGYICFLERADIPNLSAS